MPLRRGVPLTFKPATVSDAVDGTNAPPGAMLSLQNLIPDPSTNNVFVPRPAAMRITDFAMVAGIPNPGAVSALLVVGDIAYGMIASMGGVDQPFAYDLANNRFLQLRGVTAANVPASPPASPAAWTPPVMAQVGSRIIVTHPGFAGSVPPAPDYKFGWFDVSSFSGMVTGTLTLGSNIMTGNPAVAGTQPGMLVAGPFVPAGTTVVSAAQVVVSTTAASMDGLVIDGIPSNSGFADAVAQGGLNHVIIGGPGIRDGTKITGIIGRHAIQISNPCTAVGQAVTITIISGGGTENGQSTAGNTYTPSTLARVKNISGVTVGMSAGGQDISVGATVTAVIPGANGFNCVTLSQPIIGDGTANDAITFSGSTVTLSNPASGNVTDGFVFSGGTRTSPLWGAGDTNINPLPSVPVGVAQFFGRAYFALGVNGIVFSDPGLPCQVSNIGGVAQALTTNDGLAVTAIYPLMLSSPLLTDGTVQALVVFQGTSKMQQITGDAAFGTLDMAALPVATGALSPLGIFCCELGTGFISPEGLRFVDFNGRVTDPVGDAGSGVTVPFRLASVPSRIAASANAHVIRVTTINGLLPATPTPYQEFWYDIARKQWSGPHSFPVSLLQPWRDSFVVTSRAIPALYESDVVPSLSSTYVENGAPLTYLFAPTPLPDTGALAENALVDMTWAIQLPAVKSSLSNQAIWDQSLWDQAYWDAPPPTTITAFDITGAQLDETVINPTGPPPTLWDQAKWDQSLWDLTGATFQQLPIDWNGPLVFKQLVLQIAGQSIAGLRIGNGYLRYEALGYKLQYA